MSEGQQQTTSDPAQAEQSLALAEFLESVPPGQVRQIAATLRPAATDQHGRPSRYQVPLPEIQLHCPSDTCNGERFFRIEDDQGYLDVRPGPPSFEYLNYRCANCQKFTKTFALSFELVKRKRNDKTSLGVHCYKFGEIPPYGPPTPSRLITLLGPGRDLFLQGRRCENQGLGIGAFVYYRRVVEGQKDRILAEIIKVAQTVSAPPETIAALEAAQREHQFSKAIESVKDAMPQRLLIEGQNPLTLLHAALSRGLHSHSDETCLELATDIRLILAELADLLGQALKDERELKQAVARLRGLPG